MRQNTPCFGRHVRIQNCIWRAYVDSGVPWQENKRLSDSVVTTKDAWNQAEETQLAEKVVSKFEQAHWFARKRYQDFRRLYYGKIHIDDKS